jgi:hypothetical protein
MIKLINEIYHIVNKSYDSKLLYFFYYMPLIVVCGIPGSGKTQRSK